MQKYPGFVPDSSFVDWNPDPTIFIIPKTDHPIVWYGLFFAMAFLGSHFVMNKIFKTEARTSKELDLLTLYVILGTVLGARLGHCLFYDPSYYLSNPLDILKVWEGGLASHGGALGILTALILYSKNTKENLWWILDRIMVVVALSSVCIRMGNLMNSEIVGHTTSLPWGFKFIQHDIEAVYQRVDYFLELPATTQLEFINSVTARHPSQLYEALFYAVLFIASFYLWNKKKYTVPQGFFFGLFIASLFTFRFFIEFTKETQEKWEQTLPIDMGQILSLPFIFAGIAIMVYSQKKNILYKPRPQPKDEEKKQ